MWLNALLFVLFACNVLALPSITSRDDLSVSVPPSKDPFYDLPSNLGKHAPGAILKHRQSPSSIVAFGITPDNIQDSYQVLYRTNDRDSKPIATVMTVIVPKNANFGAVLSFQLAENAIIIDCAPSYGMTASSNDNPLLASPTAQLQVLLIQAALADGWVVIVPDFQGPKAAFGDSIIAGQAVLDAARAAVRSGPITGIKEDSQVVLWGYSAGAAVTKFAAELQPKYASELRLAGAAFGGVGTGSLGTISQINKGPHAGLIPPSLIGIGAQNPIFQFIMDINLKAQFKEKFYRPRHQCLDANLKTFENDDVLGMFNCWEFCVFPSLTATLLRYLQATSAPKVPVFWYQNVQDEVAPVKDVDSAVKDYCRLGANVHYQRNNATNLNHKNYGIIGAPSALGWLRDIMHGQKTTSKCTTETVSIADLPDSFLNVFSPAIRQGLVELLQKS